MRHFLVGATLLALALAATFGLASVLQGLATATRPQPEPVADRPAINKPAEPGRSPGFHRVDFQR